MDERVFLSLLKRRPNWPPPAHAVRRHGNIELDPLLGNFPEIAFVEHDGADRASRRSARGKSKCLLPFRR